MMVECAHGAPQCITQHDVSRGTGTDLVRWQVSRCNRWLFCFFAQTVRQCSMRSCTLRACASEHHVCLVSTWSETAFRMSHINLWLVLELPFSRWSSPVWIFYV